MEIKIIPCEEKYIEKVLELVVMAWTPIYEGYKEILGEEMFNETGKLPDLSIMI